MDLTDTISNVDVISKISVHESPIFLFMILCLGLIFHALKRDQVDIELPNPELIRALAKMPRRKLNKLIKWALTPD